MILFTLKCISDHTFDSWFKDSASYEQQIASKLVECPYCNSVEIRKAIMAPNIASRSKLKESKNVSEAPVAFSPSPEIELRQTLRKLRQLVEKHAENVGTNFAQEARKIADGEREKAAIYGQATPQEIKSLTEDGIEIQAIPWMPMSDA